MRRTIPHLAVGKDMIEVRQDGAEIRLRHGKRRLDGHMDARRLHAREDIGRKLWLQQRLAAGKRDAAAMAEEWQVAQELGGQNLARNRARIPCQSTRRARFDHALPKCDIFRIMSAIWNAADEDRRRLIVPRRHRPFHSDLLPRRPRGFLAEPAANAALLEKERLARRRNSFRIVAPAAIQRTTFEEYGRSDTGTIVRRKAPNVKNRAPFCLRRIPSIYLVIPTFDTPPAASRPRKTSTGGFTPLRGGLFYIIPPHSLSLR